MPGIIVIERYKREQMGLTDHAATFKFWVITNRIFTIRGRPILVGREPIFPI